MRKCVDSLRFNCPANGTTHERLQQPTGPESSPARLYFLKPSNLDAVASLQSKMVSAAVARRCAKSLRFNFNNDPSLSQRFGFSALIRGLSPCEGPARVSIRIAVIAGSPVLSHCSLSPPPRSLQHMPTHAAAQAHVIWNCMFPSLSLSLLSISHMHTCVCTPRTRFPFELSWQLSPPLFLLSAIQMKSTLYCLDRAGTCAGCERCVTSSSESH